MPTLSVERLERFMAAVLKAGGALEDEAKTVAYYLAKANLEGVDSHGIQYLRWYTENIPKKVVIPGARINVVREAPVTAVIDAGYGWGQMVAKKGMEMAIKKAGKMGVGVVCIRNIHHIGRMWDWSTMALEHDMIGIVCSNCDPLQAPHGGKTRVIGANPMSIAIPAGKHKPIIMDFSTSSSSGGKLINAARKGLKIPEGWLLTPDGRPTTDPNDYLRGGAILPMSGFRGYGLAIAVDSFAGIMSGEGYEKRVVEQGLWIQGVYLQAINISFFTPIEEFKAQIDEYIDMIKASPKADGVDEILTPGEPEFKTREKRSKEGIPIPDATWEDAVKLAGELKVNVDEALEGR